MDLLVFRFLRGLGLGLLLLCGVSSSDDGLGIRDGVAVLGSGNTVLEGGVVVGKTTLTLDLGLLLVSLLVRESLGFEVLVALRSIMAHLGALDLDEALGVLDASIGQLYWLLGSFGLGLLLVLGLGLVFCAVVSMVVLLGAGGGEVDKENNEGDDGSNDPGSVGLACDGTRRVGCVPSNRKTSKGRAGGRASQWPGRASDGSSNHDDVLCVQTSERGTCDGLTNS